MATGNQVAVNLEFYHNVGSCSILDLSVGPGCVHRLVVTMQVEHSEPNYNTFMHDLHSMLSPLQCRILEYFICFWWKSCLLLTICAFCLKDNRDACTVESQVYSHICPQKYSSILLSHIP
jgi:hypothetical protein